MEDDKKLYGGEDVTAGVHSAGDIEYGQTGEQYYDPMQESKWTRAGLTLESFKRAPGTTA
jgi:hypothetical protein